jgi:membrane protein implicated in regulation of membrane protease activity
MKTEKESLGFKLFWFLITTTPLFGSVFMLLLPLNLEIYLHSVISILLALFWAKNEKDKEDLENKIFELKQLLEYEKKNL